MSYHTIKLSCTCLHTQPEELGDCILQERTYNLNLVGCFHETLSSFPAATQCSVTSSMKAGVRSKFYHVSDVINRGQVVWTWVACKPHLISSTCMHCMDWASTWGISAKIPPVHVCNFTALPMNVGEREINFSFWTSMLLSLSCCKVKPICDPVLIFRCA